MEFFCYHRDRSDSLALRRELGERHWSYMDGYAAEMIARGPTFAGEVPSGSVHIVDLPDAAAARAFAFDEPGYQAGVYRDVLLRRWRNLLGRTMWDFPGGRAGGDRFLVLGLGPAQPADLTVPPDQDELIAYGPLLSDDGNTWLGTAALLRAPDAETARAVLGPGRYAETEVHSWQFGGRPEDPGPGVLRRPSWTTTPMAPVILFDDDCHMYVLRDQAFAESWWEMPDEFTHGFDALARPLLMAGEPHQVRLTLAGDEPDEGELRRLVAHHYRRHVRGRTPPQAAALSDFVAALPRE
ncbi:uncharacterized protein YciI [Streptomyces sp. BK022]|nr:uncharacterized protein YciI [Streptomyces sp. BK022]